MDNVLIIHADDLGLSHSVNQMTFTAMEQGFVSSASVMVVCPWFPEAAAHLRDRPHFDVGIHLTVTSEWTSYRWRPSAGLAAVASLVDGDGFLWPTVEAFCRHARPEEVECELRTQIAAAIRAGLRPTHVDSHMFALWRRPDILDIAERVSRSYGLPFLSTRLWRLYSERPGEAPAERRGLPTLWEVPASTDPCSWNTAYLRIARSLSTGLNQLLVHLGRDDEELTAITGGIRPWGAAWRHRDSIAVRTPAFHAVLRERGIRLGTWRTMA
jgi:predicted glycoside hydrolase/deacetylase ChbG (UPF0249 family)